MDRLRPGNIIDIAAVSTTPVAAWIAIGQAIHKPWAHSGFIILWGVSAGAWLVKTLIQAKKKNARRQPKRSSKEMKKKYNNIISHKSGKIKYKIPVNIREGRSSSNVYTVTIQRNSRGW